MPIPSPFLPDSPYRRLAAQLDALPNRYPPAEDESDLYLLAKIFTVEQAELASQLLPDLEGPAQIAARIARPMGEIVPLLKEMAKHGMIAMGKTAQGRLGFGLLPFVVGIYEGQAERIDAEMARLFETYYHSAFGAVLKQQPQVHRVVPVGKSIPNTMEVQPYESVDGLLDRMQSWGVMDCICRKQQALIGEGCEHPVHVCMVMSDRPGAFAAEDSAVSPLTREGASATLQIAAEAGLVHCVSNNQQDLWYICNCCTCSCAILRGMAELGIANVVAKSPFVNHVDASLCAACGDCLPACSFGALTLENTIVINEIRCVGCGLCVPVCPQDALWLDRRADVPQPPAAEADWRAARTGM